MKYFTKLLVPLVLLISVVALIGCDTPSSPDDNSSSGNPFGTNQKTVLYYDNQSNTFKGTASWTPKNTYQKVLLGYEGLSDYIEKVEWKIYHSITGDVGWRGNGNYSINSDFTRLTVSLNTNHQDVFKWADVPNVKITVTIYFTTGENVVIGNQTGYSGYEDSYPTDIDSYLYSYTSMSNDAEYYLKPSVSENKIKIKSATAYLSGGNTCTAYFDWTYPNFDSYTSFDPIVRRRYASDRILRLVMETLGGTTIDIDRSLREKKYRGTLLTSSGQHYVEMNFVSVNTFECIEYTDETYANVYKNFYGPYGSGNSFQISLSLFGIDPWCYLSDTFESIRVNLEGQDIGTLNIIN